MPRLFWLAPLLLALSLVACGGGSSKPAASSTSAAAPTAAEILAKSAAAAKVTKSFHFSLTHNNGSLPMPLNLRLISADGDYVSPDRIKAAVKTKAASANISVDLIAIGDKTWITNPFTRKWTSLPGTTVSDIADPTVIVNTLLGGLQDPKLVGQDDVDGVKAYHITGTMESGNLTPAFGDAAKPGKTVNIELWIGVDDSLPRRGKLTGPMSDDDAKDVSRLVELSRFGTAADIRAPE